jgi:hypothetical protein
VQHQTKNKESAARQIKQDRLSVVPLQPGDAVKNQLRDPDHDPAQAGKKTDDAARINFARLAAQRKHAVSHCVKGDGLDRNDLLGERFFHRFGAAWTGRGFGMCAILKEEFGMNVILS